jgi:hypothetical protein
MLPIGGPSRCGADAIPAADVAIEFTLVHVIAIVGLSLELVCRPVMTWRNVDQLTGLTVRGE